MMATGGTIFCLDLGIRSGFAYGRPGAFPTSAVVVLKRPSESRSIAYSNLICFLQERFAAETPALLVKEAMLPLQAFKKLGNAAYTVTFTAGLHAVTEAMCVRFGVPFEDVADSTVRKHFLGQARCGSREETKDAVIQRCHVLSLMPKTSLDDNRADAIATWDWACAHFGRAQPGELHLFGEGAVA